MYPRMLRNGGRSVQGSIIHAESQPQGRAGVGVADAPLHFVQVSLILLISVVARRHM